MSNSRRASSPTTKKKKVISPLLIQPRRSCATPQPSRWIDSSVAHTRPYDAASAFTHARATSVAPSRKKALPVSVRTKLPSGAAARRIVIRPVSCSAASVILRF